ncbi:ATP-binding protein [Stenotrophomonas maltophilia]|uniref:ATP-binding protein n=1 Tax=Stenotrophomonas maltophilia TaxID=40324 RepID=UPI001F5377AF|nr:ATP-binding protein [Stenotrophomonas maltophilia]
MPAEAAPVRRLARRSLRVHALLIGVVVLATLQAGLLLSAGSQLLNEERSKIEYHFRRLDGTLREQERFLRQWRLHDVGVRGQPVADASVELQRGPLYANFAVIGTEGAGRSPPTELGDRFLRFYGTFWSASRYPPPQCLLVDGQGTRGLLAPVQIVGTDASQNSPHHLRPAIADIHRALGTRPTLQRGGIVWVSVPWRDRQTWLLAIAHAPQDARLWGEDGKDSQAALACLLDPARVDDYRQVLGVPVFQRLSLFDADGQRLLGDAADASNAGTSWQAGLGGLQFRMRSERGWLAVYHVSWRQVFQHPQGPLLGATVVALLLALGGTLVLRAYRRSVIEPLRSNHARLLESEAFSRTILDNAPIGLCLLRRSDGNVLLDNTLARRWLGEDHHTGGWHGPWRRSVLAAGGTTLGDGLAYTTPEGRHLLVTATPARYRGEPAVLCLFIDLSSQHEAEQVLQQARRAADQANRAKSQFLATMSHEIRTPLYGVLGTLELLGLTPLDARQRDYLGTIQRSSSTLMQLISDILDVSKAEAGQLSLEPSPFDPVHLTEDALDSYAAAAAGKGLQFYACIDTDVPPVVCGDAARIRQILNNLISNALKFTDSGRVVVRVSARWQEQRCWLQWQVADTGIGIASERQAHLFEPFYQANPGTDAMRGTGLGLSICAHLVALMEGRLRVVSESGLGSSFSVELPLPRRRPIRSNLRRRSCLRACRYRCGAVCASWSNHCATACSSAVHWPACTAMKARRACRRPPCCSTWSWTTRCPGGWMDRAWLPAAKAACGHGRSMAPGRLACTGSTRSCSHWPPPVASRWRPAPKGACRRRAVSACRCWWPRTTRSTRRSCATSWNSSAAAPWSPATAMKRWATGSRTSSRWC